MDEFELLQKVDKVCSDAVKGIENTRLRYDASTVFMKNKNPYIVSDFWGGDNSGTKEKGKWCRYLSDISKLIEIMEKSFPSVGLEYFNINYDDDVFYASVIINDIVSNNEVKSNG